LISWNVNGLRAVLRRGALDQLAVEQPDIVCLQETKAHPDDVEALWPHYEADWNWAERRGYSGVVTLSKRKPLRVTRGLGIDEHDRKGRVLTTEFAQFFLVNVYVPNSKRETHSAAVPAAVGPGLSRVSQAARTPQTRDLLW